MSQIGDLQHSRENTRPRGLTGHSPPNLIVIVFGASSRPIACTRGGACGVPPEPRATTLSLAPAIDFARSGDRADPMDGLLTEEYEARVLPYPLSVASRLCVRAQHHV